MYGPCLSTIGGGQALTSPRRHSLGSLLHCQLADTAQATPEAQRLLSALLLRDHRVLVRLSANYSRLRGVFLCITTSFATIRHIFDTNIAINVVDEGGPFDLHALSTPPAFILDQDQILKQNRRLTSALRTGVTPRKNILGQL